MLAKNKFYYFSPNGLQIHSKGFFLNFYLIYGNLLHSKNAINKIYVTLDKILFTKTSASYI